MLRGWSSKTKPVDCGLKMLLGKREEKKREPRFTQQESGMLEHCMRRRAQVNMSRHPLACPPTRPGIYLGSAKLRGVSTSELRSG